MTTTPTKNESLPELPEPSGHAGYFTAEDMWSYARAALTREAPTEGVGEAKKWKGLYESMKLVCDVQERRMVRLEKRLTAAPPAPQRLAQGEDHKCLNPHWPCHHPSHTQPPHHDRGEVERRARELLANEMGRFSHDEQNRVPLEYALRAITAALTEAEQHLPDQDEIARLRRCEDRLREIKESKAKQQGPGEVVYQSRDAYGAWRDTTKTHYDTETQHDTRVLYTAPQVEAKRQTGEGESPSLKRIIPAAHPYPKPDQVTGADTGSIGEHAYADGWNDCRKAMIAAAAKPSGEDKTDA